MNPVAEALLKKTILPELEKGRPDFDKPHTIGVVQKVKNIIKESPELNLDEDVLVTAAYAHDWGYAHLFDGGTIVDYDDIKKVKPLHMKIGAEKIEELLEESAFDYLSSEQKERIVHLVRSHDKLNKLKDTDELVLMEADTLGAIDVDVVKPTFSKESNKRYMNGALQRRIDLFITDYAKSEAQRFVEKRREYYRKNY